MSEWCNNSLSSHLLEIPLCCSLCFSVLIWVPLSLSLLCFGQECIVSNYSVHRYFNHFCVYCTHCFGRLNKLLNKHRRILDPQCFFLTFLYVGVFLFVIAHVCVLVRVCVIRWMRCTWNIYLADEGSIKLTLMHRPTVNSQDLQGWTLLK